MNTMLSQLGVNQSLITEAEKDFLDKNGYLSLGQILTQYVMPDLLQPHPDQELILAPAGTVVIFNSHTWHGGTNKKVFAG